MTVKDDVVSLVFSVAVKIEVEDKVDSFVESVFVVVVGDVWSVISIVEEANDLLVVDVVNVTESVVDSVVFSVDGSVDVKDEEEDVSVVRSSLDVVDKVDNEEVSVVESVGV